MINIDATDPIDMGMTFRAAFIDDELGLSGEQVVDELTCDCCQTDVAVSASGPVAVYRDRTADEIRDISVSRFVDGKWLTGKTIADDNWEIAGCPVNGPAISADGDLVVVAWFSAANDQPKVRIATSTNGGASFSAALEVAGERSLGRVGVALLDDETIAVSWLQGAEGQATIMARKVTADAHLGPAIMVSSTASSFAVPQMALVGDDLVFAWTEIHDDVQQIASARIAIKTLDN